MSIYKTKALKEADEQRSPLQLPRFAHGGEVKGGIPGVDSVPIMAQQGEYVLPPEIVDNIKDGKPVGSVKAMDEMQRMYEEWQPQTDEGKRYRKELGQVIAQQSKSTPMMKHGGKVKKHHYNMPQMKYGGEVKNMPQMMYGGEVKKMPKMRYGGAVKKKMMGY